MMIMDDWVKQQIARQWRTICNSLIMSVNVCKILLFIIRQPMADELKLLNGEEMER